MAAIEVDKLTIIINDLAVFDSAGFGKNELFAGKGAGGIVFGSVGAIGMIRDDGKARKSLGSFGKLGVLRIESRGGNGNAWI